MDVEGGAAPVDSSSSSSDDDDREEEERQRVMRRGEAVAEIRMMEAEVRTSMRYTEATRRQAVERLRRVPTFREGYTVGGGRPQTRMATMVVEATLAALEHGARTLGWTDEGQRRVVEGLLPELDVYVVRQRQQPVRFMYDVNAYDRRGWSGSAPRLVLGWDWLQTLGTGERMYEEMVVPAVALVLLGNQELTPLGAAGTRDAEGGVRPMLAEAHERRRTQLRQLVLSLLTFQRPEEEEE
jgi:hypothetical protein